MSLRQGCTRLGAQGPAASAGDEIAAERRNVRCSCQGQGQGQGRGLGPALRSGPRATVARLWLRRRSAPTTSVARRTPPWLETRITEAPAATHSRASSARSTPLTTTGSPEVVRRQLMAPGVRSAAFLSRQSSTLPASRRWPADAPLEPSPIRSVRCRTADRQRGVRGQYHRSCPGLPRPVRHLHGQLSVPQDLRLDHHGAEPARDLNGTPALLDTHVSDQRQQAQCVQLASASVIGDPAPSTLPEVGQHWSRQTPLRLTRQRIDPPRTDARCPMPDAPTEVLDPTAADLTP